MGRGWIFRQDSHPKQTSKSTLKVPISSKYHCNMPHATKQL